MSIFDITRVIKSNGEVLTPYKPKNGESFELKEMQDIVGGYIEFVYLPHQQIMVVNEEGLLHDLPTNEKASRIAGITIVGDVLICSQSEIE